MAASNPLSALFDKYCSDKGTFFLSRHHYGNAYDAFLSWRRGSVRALIEVGIGDDTAPSVGAWKEYFPRAVVYAVDIKSRAGFEERRDGGVTGREAARLAAAHGCAYEPGMWSDGRARLTLGVDAADAAALEGADLPPSADVIIDDGSHAVWDQEATLLALWPRLAAGGVYIVEDLFVGRLPWAEGHERAAPSENTRCAHECFFPQRPDEHPLLFDRFNATKRGRRLDPRTEEILRRNSWFWAITGVHRGGGLDSSLVITKGAPPPPPGAAGGAEVGLAAVALLLMFALFRCRRGGGRRSEYAPLPRC